MSDVSGQSTRPANIDRLIAVIQQEHPGAGVRITGRARTVRRQAELMARRIRASRHEFLNTYRRAQHIVEMDEWYRTHPSVTLQPTIDAFVEIIERARRSGSAVSNHLSDSARDISWPVGNERQLEQIENRIRELGGSVIREPNAAGGRHWHVDWH